MNFDLSEEQVMLQEQVRRLFEHQCPSSRLRELVEKDDDWDRELWQSLADLGVLGAAIPEEYGGVGQTELDLCVVLEEAGRVVAPVPLYSSICLGAEAIHTAGSDEQKARWLPLLASGEKLAALAYPDGIGLLSAGKSRITQEHGILNGIAHPCADARTADVYIIPLQQGDRWELHLVEADQPGVTMELMQGFDQLRRHYRLRLEAVKAEALGAEPNRAMLDTLESRAAVYSAFEQIGGAEACLFMARDYAAGRSIFGRSLSSYQSIKHKLADIYVAVELARSNAYYAAWALETGSSDFLAAAAAAKISATQGYEQAARENLQVHGGIGYTWEADCHFHYRRSRLLALNCGSLALWNDRLVSELSAASSVA